MKEAGKKHRKKEDEKKDKKNKEHKKGKLASRSEVIAMLETVLAGLNAGAIVAQGDKDIGETTLEVPESVYMKTKTKVKNEEVKLSIKLSWPNQVAVSVGGEGNEVVQPEAAE
jgi:amphi-Trp domain-containing protein